MKILEKTHGDIIIAAEIINDGGVIVWPSCGVYGLACSALNRQAVEKIYSIKTRKRNKALPVMANHVCASKYGIIDKLANELINKYWPGFLGLIVCKKPMIPDFVTAGSQSIALVCPNKLAADLAGLVDGPIAATSANISGQKEILDPNVATTQFYGKVDALIKGPVLSGTLNTLLDLTQLPPSIIREGGVSLEELNHIIK